MPSPLPTRSDGYAVTVTFTISPDVWNAVMPDIAGRLVALEDVVSAGYTAAQEAGTAMAFQIITDSIAPNLATLQGEIIDLRAEIDLAEDQLNALLSAGVVASSVTIVPFAGLDASNAQDAFVELSGEIAGLGSEIDALPPEATQAQAEAGTDSASRLSPLRGAQQIAALAGDVVKQVFTSSGMFTKEADDFAYFVELWGGGGGGWSGGGGGGAYVGVFLLASDLAATTSVAIGAGGLGWTSSRAAGNGGDTTFGPLTAKGGKAPINTSDGGASGSGAIAPTQSNDAARKGKGSGGYGGGSGGSYTGSNQNGDGGDAVMGGAGGGAYPANGDPPGAGGISTCGGNGGAGGALPNGNGQNGQAPGGGGGARGASSSNPAGNGARGEVRVWRFKRKKVA